MSLPGERADNPLEPAWTVYFWTVTFVYQGSLDFVQVCVEDYMNDEPSLP